MRFLIFNLVVAGALIYLFTTDRQELDAAADLTAEPSKSLAAKAGAAGETPRKPDKADDQATPPGTDVARQPFEATEPYANLQQLQDLVSDLWDEALSEEEPPAEPPATTRPSGTKPPATRPKQAASAIPDNSGPAVLAPARTDASPLPEPPPLASEEAAASVAMAVPTPQPGRYENAFVDDVPPDVAARRDLVVGDRGTTAKPSKAPEIRRQELLQLVQDMELFAVEALSQ